MSEIDKPEDDSVIGVSFDLSKTRTGICAWVEQEPKKIWSVSFQETHGTGHLLASFRHHLPQIMVHPDIVTWIGYEDVRPVNKYHSEIHFGMLGVLMEWAYRHEVPILGVTATQVKKTLFGKGKASKEEMLTAARDQFPALNVQNHDEADALGVGLACVRDLIEWKDDQPEVKKLEAPF